MDAADAAQIAEALDRAVAIARASAAPAGVQKHRDGEVVCAECDEPIPAERLAAMPGACRCVDCQEIHDSER